MNQSESLHLVAYFIANKLREMQSRERPGLRTGPVEVVTSLVKLVREMHMEEDIELFFKISSQTGVGFESKTKKGQAVLTALRTMLEFPPCPDDLCEYDRYGTCRWCGMASKH